MADQVTDEADVMLTSVESPTITADWFDLTHQESNSFLEEDVLLFFYTIVHPSSDCFSSVGP